MDDFVLLELDLTLEETDLDEEVVIGTEVAFVEEDEAAAFHVRAGYYDVT